MLEMKRRTGTKMMRQESVEMRMTTKEVIRTKAKKKLK